MFLMDGYGAKVSHGLVLADKKNTNYFLIGIYNTIQIRTAERCDNQQLACINAGCFTD